MPAWQLGLIVGLALLTKITIYFLAGLAPLAIWLKWRRERKPTQALLRSLLIFALVAGLMGGLWWLRNIAVYGFPDFLGLAAHDAVVADQPRTADFIAQRGMNAYLSGMLNTTFKSFWGQFGWMALPLDNVLGGWIYRGFALLALAGLSGLLLASHPRPSAPDSQRMPAAVLLLLLTAILLVALQFIYYNIEFQQWQGRYLYPALIPIACLLTLRHRLLAGAPAIPLGRAALADAAGHGLPARAGSLPAVSGDRARFVAGMTASQSISIAKGDPMARPYSFQK